MLKEFFGKEENITESDLEELLDKNSEHAKLEIKSSISNKEDSLLQPLVSFANGSGGLLVLGVNEGTNKIIGLKKEYDKEKISNIIKSYIEPDNFSNPEYMNIKEIKLKNSNSAYCIGVHPTPFIVGYRKDKAYKYYIRRGNGKAKLSPADLHTLATIKEEFGYNKKYREDISECIKNLIEETARFLNTGTGILVKVILEENETNLISIVNNAGLKNLSKNIYEETIERGTDIYKTKHETHNKNLTYREEELFEEWQDGLAHSFDKYSKIYEPELKKIEEQKLVIRWIDAVRKLEGHTALGYSSEISLASTLYEIFSTYDSSKEKTLLNHYKLSELSLSYESNFLRFKTYAHEIFEKAKDTPGIMDLEYFIKTIDAFPSDFSRCLIPILKPLILLKRETDTVLMFQ